MERRRNAGTKNKWDKLKTNCKMADLKKKKKPISNYAKYNWFPGKYKECQIG